MTWLMKDGGQRLRKIAGSSSASSTQTTAHIDGIEDALAVLEDSCSVLLSLRNRIKSLAEPVMAASVEADSATRALFADEYDDRRESVLVDMVGPQDAAYLLLGDSSEELEVSLSNSFSYRVGKFYLVTGDEGLALPAPASAFDLKNEIHGTLKSIEMAVEKIDRAMMRYRQDQRFLKGKLAQHRRDMVE